MFPVLYVDDEPDLLAIAKLYLEDTGKFLIDTAQSVPAAMALLELSQYEAIISDYQMPGTDGIQFLKQIRASGNTIPFVIFTGRGREEIVIQALNEGADFYIQKGGEPESQFTELTHKVRQAILRRKTEQRICDQERRESDILNFLPEATFAIDTNGIVIVWNQAMEKSSGVAASAMLGKGDYEYALPFYHERRPVLVDLVFAPEKVAQAKYSFIKTEGDILTTETTYASPKGEDTVLWAKATPLHDTNGAVIGAIESIRDITDYRRAKNALEVSERRYRTLFENTGTAMFILEEDMLVSLVNSEFEKISGYTKEEFEGKRTWIELVVPEDAVWMKELHRKRRQKNSGDLPWHYEFRFITKKRTIRTMFLSIALIPDTKQTIVSLVDITDRN